MKERAKVGDKLAAEYIDAIAVYVRRAGAPPSATIRHTEALAIAVMKPAS